MDEQQIRMEIDQLQQQGYLLMDDGLPAGACRVWQKAWAMITRLMETGRYDSLEALDRTWRGRQSISSWASDFTAELKYAGKINPELLQVGIDFCRQYIRWSTKKYDLNNQNRRRIIAENTFTLGKPDEGDAIYESFLAENPVWGWGWLSWANQYALHSQAPWYDLHKAEAILYRALAVHGITDRPMIVERMRDVLTKQGRTIEASGIA